MFRFVVAALFCLISSASQAQGYAGAVLALSRVGGGCQGGDLALFATNYTPTCDSRGRAFKFYAGSHLTPSRQIDLAGLGSINTFEVGLINFGKGGSTGVVDLIDVNSPPDIISNNPASKVSSANAITFSAGASFPVVDSVAFLARLGAAYVSSTVTTYINGARLGSETASKFKPYIGLGFSYEPVQNIKLIGSFDWTKFDVAGDKSSLRALGLGAEFGF